MLGYNQWCPKCKSGKGIVKLTIPYAAKLLIQEVSPFHPSAQFYIEVRADYIVDGYEHHAQALSRRYSLSLSWRRFR
jgi:hypothetical protein